MNESILFVDDEKQILNSLRRVFATGEYRVFFAESGEEALSILAEEEINLLITDVRMPGMSGVEYKKIWGGVESCCFISVG